jgi:hypothetical protein
MVPIKSTDLADFTHPKRGPFLGKCPGRLRWFGLPEIINR